MVDVESLTDAELRTKLIEYGFPVMPITGTTRKVMAKKLRLLMENKNKVANDGRRSLARYSSEEESDSDMKTARKEKRRATMAAPPTKVPVRKSTRKIDVEIEERPVTKPLLTEEKRVTTRTTKITKITENDYDTGSDSEPEIIESTYKSPTFNNHDYNKINSPVSSNISSTSFFESPRKYSPPKTVDTTANRNISYVSHSPSRYTSFSSAASGGDQASDHLNQIRARLSLGNSGYDRPLYSSSAVSDLSEEKIETPFLSNFTRRLSEISSNKSQKLDYDLKNDVIKEHDTNGSGSYSPRTYLSRPVRRDFVRDYQSGKENNIKNNLVSFAVIALALLFFLVLGLLYMGMHNGHTSLTTGLTIPYCEPLNVNSRKGVNCIVDTDLQSAVDLHKVLTPELYKRTIAYHCADSKTKPFMTEDDIVTFIQKSYALQNDGEIREHLNNLELLTFTNPNWGIALFVADRNDDTVLETMQQVVMERDSNTIALEIIKPELPWRCSLYNKIATIFQTAVLLAGIVILLYCANIIYKYLKHHQQKQKDELFYMVERILDTLQSNSTEDGENFLVINHVRDMILPINDRKRMEKIWRSAVQFINENESRVRTELQVVQGEPYEVWRWLGNANVSVSGSPRNKSWQGQAFETQVGSVNSLPCSPTPCLKVRGMVDDGDRNLLTIKEAVLSKCAHQCRILHCSVDTNSKCVYLKCADQNDAAIAYRSLHGWWYAGNLLTVKYLRLERYMQRYPDSPISGPPFLKALQPAMDWTN